MTEKNVPTTPNKSETVASARRKKGRTRAHDVSLAWVERDYPQLAAWRALAVDWLKGETRNVSGRLVALVAFLERYIIEQELPVDPAVFLARTTALPDFYKTACPDSVQGLGYNRNIRAFLDFVLLRDFSGSADDGQPVVSPAFRNPVAHLSTSGLPRRSESVHSPLPYGYIDELRRMLAEGPNFQDWQWAQNAIGSEIGRRGGSFAPDWFDVTGDQIDRTDPDCVWRVRKCRPGYRGGQVIEMWSPVRWVALLVKLIVPLRTFQVRMLDSGEADTWRYASGRWTLNTSRLSQGSERRPHQQGVFRRSTSHDAGDIFSPLLYINTNKTADIARSASDKGYVLPWSFGGPLHQDVFYWLEKLRNWQEKYNPVSRRTAWTELDGRHMDAKSDVQLAGYPDSCFLFRTPEARGVREHHLPITAYIMNRPWYELLGALELRLEQRGETHRNGTPIRFRPEADARKPNTTKTNFPLHSLRVSLVTALALEGQVPFPILQKLVGHSRLLMTLYYTKPGASHIREVLTGAAERLEINKEATIQNFLLDTDHDELLKRAICTSVPSLAVAIPMHPAARNPAGWMPLHHGLCLVGGNTSEGEGSGTVGGCHNGGPAILNANWGVHAKYGPVPGGSRNCVRCRWFVTEAHYLPALVAHFNTLAYHFDEARNACLARESEFEVLKKERADAEESSLPFARLDVYRQSERLWEAAMKRFSDLAEDLVACWRLIERCRAALELPTEDGTQLVAVGAIADVHVGFEETDSELLQLAGVCENVEVYPDLDPGKAVLRRSQLLDAALYRDDLKPMFMLLNEEDQLRVGNSFMRQLAERMNAANPVLGQRELIRLMDAGVSLSDYFNMDLASLLPNAAAVRPLAAKAHVLSKV